VRVPDAPPGYVVPVDPQDPRGLSFRIEQHGNRYLVMGPHFKRMLLTSFEADDLPHATARARTYWNTLNPELRERYYEKGGSYGKRFRRFTGRVF
jgi:hypothetical protein